MSIVVIVVKAQMLISRSSSSSSNHGLSAGNVPESVGKAKPILFLLHLIVEEIKKGECPGSGGGGGGGSGELEAAERAGVVGREPGENALRMVEMRARELLGLGVEEKVVLANGTEKDWVRVQHG